MSQGAILNNSFFGLKGAILGLKAFEADGGKLQRFERMCFLNTDNCSNSFDLEPPRLNSSFAPPAAELIGRGNQ